MKVLIIEDEILSAATLSKVLAKLGHEVCGPAASYDQALHFAETEKPQLAFCDISIDGSKDGIETANSLKEKFDLPVIFVTTSTDSETIAKAQAAEQYGFIIKPYRAENIKAGIALAISSHEKKKHLEENIQKFSAMVGAIEEAVFIISKDGEIEFCNTVAEKITGWNVEENKGTPINDILEVEETPGWDLLKSLPAAEVVKIDESLSDHIFLITRNGAKIKTTGKLTQYEGGYLLTLQTPDEADEEGNFIHIIRRGETKGNADKYFFIREKNTLYRVLVDDIHWLESLGNYVKICTAGKNFISHITMKEMEAILPPWKFIRIHRSYIVNKDLISTIDYQELTVNENKLPIGKTFREELIKNLVII